MRKSQMGWVVGAQWLAITGLAAMLVANTFEAAVLKVDVDDLLANVGALLLVVGMLQWLFDRTARKAFFDEIRLDILGSKRVLDSGIVDYHAESKDVDFSDLFLTSQRLVIGVNYSSRLIDNSITLLTRRCQLGLKTTIVVVKPDSVGGQFLEKDLKLHAGEIAANVRKLEEIRDEQNKKKECVEIVQVGTVLRYSFVLFDSRAWIIVGTNGRGRRAVPGFMVRGGGSWFDHLCGDVDRLLEAPA